MLRLALVAALVAASVDATGRTSKWHVSRRRGLHPVGGGPDMAVVGRADVLGGPSSRTTDKCATSRYLPATPAGGRPGRPPARDGFLGVGATWPWWTRGRATTGRSVTVVSVKAHESRRCNPRQLCPVRRCAGRRQRPGAARRRCRATKPDSG